VYELDNMHKITRENGRAIMVRFTCVVPVLVALLGDNDDHATA
jgi:hypothetical protein